MIQLFKSKVLLIVAVCMAFSACTEQELVVSGEPGEGITRSSFSLTDGTVTELPSLSFQSLLEIAATLATNGVEAISPILEAIDLPGDLATAALRTFKVSTQFPHPAGTGEMIDISGVVVVPAEYSDSLRFVISPVPTYTANASAPSNIFAGEVPLLYDQFLNYLYFVALNALQNCAIFFPDYPGFGDSYGQCFHPYAMRDVLVNSTIDLAKVAQDALTSYEYLYKKEVIVTGYSQGGLVATAVGRELDLNGDSYGLPMNLLIAGGVPADLVTMIDIARVTTALPLSFIFPYAILGYQLNGYTDLNTSDLLNSPYDETCYTYFNGQYSVVEVLAAFPLTNVGLLTLNNIIDNKFNTSVALLDELLAENSIEAWKNTAPVIFIHGLLDEAVYYANIVNFIDDMEALGGTPVLHTNLLTEHILTMLDYFVELGLYIPQYN